MMSGICMFQLQIEFVLAWAQGSNVMLKCLTKHSVIKVCGRMHLSHSVFLPWALDASGVLPPRKETPVLSGLSVGSRAIPDAMKK